MKFLPALFALLLGLAARAAEIEVPKDAAGQVEIEARFIEVPEALALKLKDPAGKLLFPTAAKGGKPAARGRIVVVPGEGQMQPFLARLLEEKGVDVLSAPRVITRSGRRAVIEIIREVRYPTEWKADAEKKGAWVPTAFEVRNAGVTLEAEPTIRGENTIDLQLTPQVVEYLGAIDVETGKAVKAGNPAAGAQGAVAFPDADGRRLRPVFSARKVTTAVSIGSGQSVILSGIGETEDTKPFKAKTPGRRLIVIITARQRASE